MAVRIDEQEAGPSESSRPFWIGFAIGWSAYFTVLVTFEIGVRPDRVVESIGLALLNVVPLVLMTWVVALNRRRLLRPDWSPWRTIAVHKVVGLSFAAATTLVMRLLVSVTDYQPPELMEGQPEWVNVIGTMMSALFLYVIFIGFLMWSESLRRVRESQAAMARQEVLRAEAEAKAVRAQFNPHFVFNTLHSLMLLVRADPTAAERAIEDVATLIRYASIVQRLDVDAVPLGKELEVARRYLGLERLRLGDRLHLRWEVEAGSEGLRIPAFVLQTAVENAVKHGIEPQTGGGTVAVRVAREGARLRVVVTDDGIGCDPGAVESPGHGLSLLRRRLEALYGEDAVVSWETGPDRGFRLDIELPAEPAPSVGALDVIQEGEAQALVAEGVE